MKHRLNLWIEQDGQVVLSRWRIRLLETIAETGSISAAAEKLEIQYRRAWDKLHEMEAGLGVKLVDTAVGGKGGGGARLTAAGQRAVAEFHAFENGFEAEVSERFRKVFHTT